MNASRGGKAQRQGTWQWAKVRMHASVLRQERPNLHFAMRGARADVTRGDSRAQPRGCGARCAAALHQRSRGGEVTAIGVHLARKVEQHKLSVVKAHEGEVAGECLRMGC